MFLVLKRIFRTAFQGLKRNSWLTIANISIMVLSVLIFSSTFLLNFAANFFINEIQERVDVSIYFKTDILEEDILRIRDEILTLPEIKQVNYISREQAMEDFLKRRGESQIAEILQQLGTNPLSASLNIIVKDVEYYEKIIEYINNSAFYEKLISVDLARGQEVINRISAFVYGINIVAFIIVIVLSLISITVSFNTIRMAIYSLREEIEIMKLVGASNWFVRGPFLIEGAIQGLIASLVTTIFIMIPLVSWLGPRIDAFVPGLNIFGYFWGDFWIIFGWQTLFITGLGITSSFIAINKYLKV